jgi:hypothetical protein
MLFLMTSITLSLAACRSLLLPGYVWQIIHRCHQKISSEILKGILNDICIAVSYSEKFSG